MTKRKIILFGGTFDPIHLGHTTVAAAAGEKIEAEKVIFIPAKRSPLKAFFPHACDGDRLTMVKLAIAGNKAFETSDYELKKSGPNYTIETVKYFQEVLGVMFRFTGWRELTTSKIWHTGMRLRN